MAKIHSIGSQSVFTRRVHLSLLWLIGHWATLEAGLPETPWRRLQAESIRSPVRRRPQISSNCTMLTRRSVKILYNLDTSSQSYVTVLSDRQEVYVHPPAAQSSSTADQTPLGSCYLKPAVRGICYARSIRLRLLITPERMADAVLTVPNVYRIVRS